MEEGDNRKGLESVLKDMMAFDNTPLIVAWDQVKNKVRPIFFLFSLLFKFI